MHKRSLLFSLIFFSVFSTMAQQSLQAIPSLSSSETNKGKFYYANRNEPPRAIEFADKSVATSDFLPNINSYFDIPAEFNFTEAESNTDDLGMRHHLLQQYYKGIPLEGLVYRVHEKEGFVRSANGKAIREIVLDTLVMITEEQAFNLAVSFLQTKDTTFRKARKVIVSKDFTFAPGSFSVAFQFDIDVSLIERWRISIDARHGQVVNKVSLVNSCGKENEPPLPYSTGTGVTNYYGNQTIRVEKFENGSSRLRGVTENGGIIGTYDFHHASLMALIFGFPVPVYDFSSATNTYNTLYQRPAVSVQWAAEQAYEYYFIKHNRDSYDNAGAAIKSYVHVDRDLNNAFWTGKLMAFGDGSNNNPLVELDVVSHELTHGVTQYEAGLQYAYEPGALNESFSDIFGKAVEFYTFGDTATWQLAKHYSDGGLRDFSNPNLKNQPDTYAGDMWYTGYEDSGGVHYNSGVQNFWFYLLCEGGSGVNDHDVGYSINAIGMDAATKIAYRNLTEYLSYSSDYLDSRIGSMLATADLYGKDSEIYQEVDKAWDAVGVIDEPIITSLEIYDITATTVKIRGSLQPRGDVVTYHFEYGPTPALGSSSEVYEYTDRVEGIVTGLLSETQYYLRLVATNENGSSYDTVEFTTISLAPLVKIKETADVTETTATLYAEINPNSLHTSFYFEYGMTPDVGLTTPTYALSDTTEFLDVSATVDDLQPRQTYYYRVVATNGFSSSTSELTSFFTATKPVISSFTPAAAHIDTEVTINGANFNAVSEKNMVSFGATRATVLSANSTEIKVKVPPGASLGPISVLDAESGLIAESIREFVPTFPAEFDKGDLQLRVGISDFRIYSPAVQDMDGDNRPDIVGGYNEGFMVYQNVSQGGDITSESFIRNTFPAGLSTEVYLVDFDGNGLKDVVGRDGDALRIYPNLSVPGFIFFGVPIDVPTGNFMSLSFNDFDQDGRIDIAIIRSLQGDSSMLKIIRNQNPKGILSSENFKLRYELALPLYANDLHSEDLNNDGDPDLICETVGRNYVAILKNSHQAGDLVFEQIDAQDLTRSRFARYLSHDLDQDGWKDVVSHSPYEDINLSILQNAQSSTISLAAPVVVLTGQVDSRVVQIGDIDGDGKVDLLTGINDGKFIFLRNQTTAGESLSAVSFEVYETYAPGREIESYQSSITVSDLNGDGRPEIIATNSVNYYPYDGYFIEIWQNAPADCPDASEITISASSNTVTIVLPPNTTLDQFQIEYRGLGSTYWNQVYSTELYVSPGYQYQLRARRKCYLGFTGYHYLDFTTDCVDTNSFSISNITASGATLSAYYFSTFEVQYSSAGEDQWTSLPQNESQITNLSPGTSYDVRFRGRCYTLSDYKYMQFTTLCPKLSAIAITDLQYNSAVAAWTSDYPGDVVVEYSTDAIHWTLAEDRTLYPLIPAQQYLVRAMLVCPDANAEFIQTTFTTPCPKVSTISIGDITPFSATISWVDESNTGNYTLTYFMAGGPVTTEEMNLNSFQLNDLSPGTQYSVTIAPHCAGDKDFVATTFNTVCYVPFDLSVDAITQTTAELSWKDHFSVLPYSIDYSIAGSNKWLTTGTELTNISLAELRPGTQYEARVHINCISETAPYVSARFETGLYGEVTLAPNPTDDRISIYPAKNLIGNRFSIYDNTGRAVADGELRDYTIDLSDFSPGMYMLKIDGEKPFRIVKN